MLRTGFFLLFARSLRALPLPEAVAWRPRGPILYGPGRGACLLEQKHTRNALAEGSRASTTLWMHVDAQPHPSQIRKARAMASAKSVHGPRARALSRARAHETQLSPPPPPPPMYCTTRPAGRR